MIKAILACDESGGVSKNGTIPWPKNLKDLKWFKKKHLKQHCCDGLKNMG
jgi:dihydrofolate reductase